MKQDTFRNRQHVNLQKESQFLKKQGSKKRQDHERGKTRINIGSAFAR